MLDRAEHRHGCVLLERSAVAEPLVVRDVHEPARSLPHVRARQRREDGLEADEGRERAGFTREQDRLAPLRPFGLAQLELAERRDQPLERHALAERHQVSLGVGAREGGTGREQARGVRITQAPAGVHRVVGEAAEHRDPGAGGEGLDLVGLVGLLEHVAAGRGLGPDEDRGPGRGLGRPIREREERGDTVETRFVAIEKADITGAEVRGRTAQIRVRFVSQLVSVTRDKSNNVIDGNPDKVTDVTDVWTFARDISARDPNWKLVATEAGQ